MKKLNKIKWYNLTIAAGIALVLLGNPLALSFIADGVNIAILWVAELVDVLFYYAIDYTLVFVGLGLLLIVFGAGVKIGADNQKSAKKLKQSKGNTNGMQYELS